MRAIWLVAVFVTACYADIYLHFPKGSNNRMDDGGRDRNNGGRLFDSMNNNRGGNNRGTGQEYYYMGSTLPISWVADQGCGANEPHTSCTIIMQYACDRWMRDGYETEDTWTWTIPYYDWERPREDCMPYYEKWMDMGGRWPRRNCSYDFRFGMHESHAMYENCRRTSRNKGLFMGSVKLSNDRNGAIFTRQNPDGWRRGYECPEERDYYPYWRPSMWRDIAILTDDVARCPAYQAESFNVKSRWECVMREEYHAWMKKNRFWTTGYVPITEEACTNPSKRLPPEDPMYDDKGDPLNVGVWREVPALGVEAPYCGPTPHTRANYLGNQDGAGYPFIFNWTIPEISFPDSTAIDRCVFRIRYNVSAVDVPNYGWESSTSVGPSVDWTVNAQSNGAPTSIPIWEKYGKTEPRLAFQDQAKELGNVGNGYVFGDYPYVDIFGSLVPNNKTVYLALGINTREVGSVFQDRTHTFSFRPLPPNLKNYTIHNLGVIGKRGNIVQTFPGTEYDFFPFRLEVSQGDLIHIQWNGANTNPRGNAGEGPAGFDRSTLLVQRHTVYYEVGQELNTYNNIGQWGTSYPEPFTPDSGPRFLGFSYDDLYKLAIPPLYSGYFDLGLRQVGGTAAAYHFLSTRNNNFTNRSQKGKVVVLARDQADIHPVPAEALTDVNANDDIGWAYIHYNYDDRRRGQFNIRLTDAGPSGGATNWVRVEPHYISVPDGNFVMLKIDHPWVPFTYGRIFWTEHKEEEAQEIFTNTEKWSWSGEGTASAKIMVGGYYKVKNVVNGSAVGGVAIAVVGVGIIIFFLVRRFGCRCWNKTDPAAAADVSSQRETLLTSGPSSSSSPAAPPATTAGV